MNTILIEPTYIILIAYLNGILSYILGVEKLKILSYIYPFNMLEKRKIFRLKIGHNLLLNNIPVGTYIHNINFIPFNLPCYVRASGSYAQIISKNSQFTFIRLKSNEIRMVYNSCKATIGKLKIKKINYLKVKAGNMR